MKAKVEEGRCAGMQGERPRRLRGLGVRAAVAVALRALVLGALAPAAQAASLFVAAGAPPGGDGSRQHPLRTIHEAVALADPRDTTVIHVSPGTYPEGGIVLDSRVRLLGSTVIVDGPSGHPDRVRPGTETLILSTGSGSPAEVLTIAHDHVEVRGFVIDGAGHAAFGIHVDGIGRVGADGRLSSLSGVSIQDNRVVNAFVGIQTDNASVDLVHNLVEMNVVGSGSSASQTADAVHVLVANHQARDNFLFGLVVGGGVHETTPPDSELGYTASGAIDFEIRDSDFRGSFAAGIHLADRFQAAGVPGRPSVVRGDIKRTKSTGSFFGLIVDHPALPPDTVNECAPAGVPTSLSLRSRRSGLGGNVVANALVSFRNWQEILFGSSGCLMKGTTIDLTDDGSLGPSLVVNPCFDDDGSELENVLRVNGESVECQPPGEYMPRLP